MALAVDHDSAHAGDNNQGRGARGVIRGMDGGLEKWHKGDGCEADGCDVGIKNGGPGRGLLGFPESFLELVSER